MRNSNLRSVLHIGYINKREFIDTLVKIINSYFTFHKLYERKYVGYEFLISYCVQNYCIRFCDYFASEVMVHTDTYSQNTDQYLSPFINYLDWDSSLQNFGMCYNRGIVIK